MKAMLPWRKYILFTDMLLVFAILILAMATPVTYFFLEYGDRSERVAFYAQRYAVKFKQAIQENPEYWLLSVEKFIETFADLESVDGVETIEVYDDGGHLWHRETLAPPSVFSIRKSAEIRYNNQVCGSVVLYANFGHIMQVAFTLLSVFSIMAFTVYKLQQINQKGKHEIAARKEIERILKRSKEELTIKNKELTRALTTLKHTQNKLIQQEKLAGIGQLAAGVAHEINNPLGFVISNVEMLEEYFAFLNNILSQYQELADVQENHQALTAEQKQELVFIFGDLPGLFRETLDGLTRMAKIVKGMRLYSHMNHRREFEQYDLLAGLNSALVMAQNELKPDIKVEQQREDIPPIEAVGDEINQVLLNIIVNAAHAIKAACSDQQGIITVSTWAEDEFVYCEVRDNGAGINPEDLNSIFNPFFTTKAVGQGTGMGLSISYDIIVNRHNGEILVESLPGNGATFTLKLPIKHRIINEE